jgi:hypothetical protein
MQVDCLHISIDAEEIVLENLQLPSDATAEELRLYQKMIKNGLAIFIHTLALEILTSCPPYLSTHELRTHHHSLDYKENAFTFYTQLRKVMVLHQDVSDHEIDAFIQLYEKQWAILCQLTTLTSQVNSESEQYRIDFGTFLSHDCAKGDCLLASLMEHFPNEVNHISPKNAASIQEVKNKFLNLHSASGNNDSGHHMVGNKKNENSKMITNSTGSSSSNLVPPPTPRTPPPPHRQRLAPRILNTILRKRTNMVGMSAPSVRTLTSRSLRIREQGRRSTVPGITRITILRSRASFTKMPK